MLRRQPRAHPLLQKRLGQLGPLARSRRRSHRLPPPLRLVQVSRFSLHHTTTSFTNTPSSCLTARRRRKAGRQPFYGTGWAARPGNGANTAQPYYANGQNNYAAPAPPYSPPNNAHEGYYSGGANQGYYNNGQQNGVELQSPQPTYGGGYAPPPGPPPTKGDGIVR